MSAIKNRETTVGDRGEWILRLLYAPDNTGTSRAIYGRTRLMNACFLIDKKIKENFEVKTDFDFFAHKYGPFDKHVYTAIEDLEAEGMIEVVDSEELSSEDGDKHKLTPRGKQKASELYAELPERQQDLIDWVKYKPSQRPLSSLVNYVYSNYPEYTTESKIA